MVFRPFLLPVFVPMLLAGGRIERVVVQLRPLTSVSAADEWLEPTQAVNAAVENQPAKIFAIQRKRLESRALISALPHSSKTVKTAPASAEKISGRAVFRQKGQTGRRALECQYQRAMRKETFGVGFLVGGLVCWVMALVFSSLALAFAGLLLVILGVIFSADVIISAIYYTRERRRTRKG